MHIETRVLGKRKKYYLAHSVRHGKRVRKLRFYLGSDLSKAGLEQKRKYAENVIKDRIRAEKIIRDPLRAALSEKELEEIKALEAEAEGDIKVLHLPEEGWEKFTKLFTYDTNAIEGSTVTSSEVENILEKNKIPKDKPKHEIS